MAEITITVNPRKDSKRYSGQATCDLGEFAYVGVGGGFSAEQAAEDALSNMLFELRNDGVPLCA